MATTHYAPGCLPPRASCAKVEVALSSSPGRPSSTIKNTQSYRVFVIQDGVAKLRVVQIGDEEGGTVQILSGVNADEIVATSNVQQLFEGARVR